MPDASRLTVAVSALSLVSAPLMSRTGAFAASPGGVAPGAAPGPATTARAGLCLRIHGRLGLRVNDRAGHFGRFLRRHDDVVLLVAVPRLGVGERLRPALSLASARAARVVSFARICRRSANWRKARRTPTRPRRSFRRTETNKAPRRRWGTRPCRLPPGCRRGSRRRNRKRERSCRRRCARKPRRSRHAPRRRSCRRAARTRWFGQAARDRAARIWRPSAAALRGREPRDAAEQGLEEVGRTRRRIAAFSVVAGDEIAGAAAGARLQVGEIGLHARDLAVELAALRRRIRAEEQKSCDFRSRANAQSPRCARVRRAAARPRPARRSNHGARRSLAAGARSRRCSAPARRRSRKRRSKPPARRKRRPTPEICRLGARFPCVVIAAFISSTASVPAIPEPRRI